MTLPSFFYQYRKQLLLIGIPLISLIMHWRAFPTDLMSVHAWRQTQTQTNIVNFYEEDFNIMNPRRNDRGDGDGIFRMEFPIMQWLYAGVYKVFGNHVIISRILTFILGLFSLLGLYWLLFYLFQKEEIALLGAWCLNFSPAFFYYTVNPLPDNFALCFGIWGVAYFFKWYRSQHFKDWWLMAIFLSIGTLAKLPFILYYCVPGIFLLNALRISRITFSIFFKQLIVLFLAVLPALTWYAWVIPTWHGNGIVRGILDLAASPQELGRILIMNLISVLPEMLLNFGAVLFFLGGFYFMRKRKVTQHPLFFVFLTWGICLLLYFFFELNMITDVHDYYLFPFLPVLFIIVAYGAYHLLQTPQMWLKNLSIIALCLLPLFTHLRMKVRWNYDKPGVSKSLIDYKETLRNVVPKDALCIVGSDPSHYIYHYYLDKKGWTYEADNFTVDDLKSYIEKGATYIYTDTPNVYKNTSFTPFFEKLIFEGGDMKIYQLKTN